MRSARVVSAEWAVAFYNLACLRLRIAWNIARGHARDHGLHALPLHHVVFFEAACLFFYLLITVLVLLGFSEQLRQRKLGCEDWMVHTLLRKKCCNLFRAMDRTSRIMQRFKGSLQEELLNLFFLRFICVSEAPLFVSMVCRSRSICV